MAHVTQLTSARTFLTPPGRCHLLRRVGLAFHGPSQGSVELGISHPQLQPYAPLLSWGCVTDLEHTLVQLLTLTAPPVQDPRCSAQAQAPRGAQPLTSVVTISTCTLLGRGRSGWKRLARATRRCKVASRSLLKMAGRGEGHKVRTQGPPKCGAIWRFFLWPQKPSADQGDLCPAFWKTEVWR